MIQSSAEQTRSRASAGRPKGPTANETSVTAVAAKKKRDAAAIRRRSSWAASLAQTAQARRSGPQPEDGRGETEEETEAAIVYRLTSAVSRSPSSIVWSGSRKSRESFEA